MENVKDYPPYLDCPKPRKIQTNADKLRAMSPGEVEQRFNTSACPTPNRKCPDHYCCAWCWLEWLRQPAEENAREE